MKYVLMYHLTPDLDANADPAAAEDVYKDGVYEWFGTHSDVMADAGAELLGIETATGVKFADGGPVVVDGPFNEAKEVVGGFSVIEVPDMDAAIAIVRTWPLLELPGNAVEIRARHWSRTTHTWRADPHDHDGRPPGADAAPGSCRAVGGLALATVPGLRRR